MWVKQGAETGYAPHWTVLASQKLSCTHALYISSLDEGRATMMRLFKVSITYR